MSTQEQYDLIDRYLFNQLSEEDLAKILKLEAEDPQFAQAIKIHRFEHQAMESMGEEYLRKTIANWEILPEEDLIAYANTEEENAIEQTGKIKRLYPSRWLIAASIALLATLGWWLLETQFSQKALVTAFYEDYEQDWADNRTLRRSTDPVKNGNTGSPVAKVLKKGEALYKKGEYEPAIKELNSIQKGEPEYALAQIITGMSLSGLHKYDEAIKTFQYLKTNDNGGSVYVEETAEWLETLTRLINRKSDNEGKRLLKKIAMDNTHIYYNPAKKLQQKLNSSWMKR